MWRFLHGSSTDHHPSLLSSLLSMILSTSVDSKTLSTRLTPARHLQVSSARGGIAINVLALSPHSTSSRGGVCKASPFHYTCYQASPFLPTINTFQHLDHYTCLIVYFFYFFIDFFCYTCFQTSTRLHVFERFRLPIYVIPDLHNSTYVATP